MSSFEQVITENTTIWNNCADIYEKQIVNGHPDIINYETFEEYFLDSLIKHLIKQKKRNIKIMDIGCGSGRIHNHYALQSLIPDIGTHPSSEISGKHSKHSSVTDSINEVWGIDFSKNMLQLAKHKLFNTGINNQSNIKLNFQLGSAFEVEPLNENCFPVVISLINTIGVMQGEKGAILLLKTMKNIIHNTGGILLLSCYRKKHLNTYGLGQYESTMDVSGQPFWLKPDEYANKNYHLVPLQHKLAYDANPELAVNVYDSDNNCIAKNYILKRKPALVKDLLDTGKIETHNNYSSNWYSYKQIHSWINELWGNDTGNIYHIKTNSIDPIRAEPGQIAIYTSDNILENYFSGISKR